MASFDVAMEVVLQWEGGLSNDPDDRGGLTNYGISSRVHPGVDVENLTLERAKEIYWRLYWLPIQGEQFVSHNLATAIMVAAVNVGVARATRMIQEVTPNLTVDAQFGPNTIAAVNAVGDPLIAPFTLRVIRHYTNQAYGNPSQEKFLVGWCRRALDAACVL